MFSFLSSKKKEELSIIIDIQSGLVRGSLVFNKENQISQILYIITKEISQKDFTGSSFLVKAMIESLSDVINKLSDQFMAKAKEFGYSSKSIKNIHFILSSPWVLSQSKTITIKFDKTTDINKKLIQSVIEDERKIIEKKFKEMDFNKDSSISNSDWLFIEQKIFEIKLNGYKVNDCENKKAQDLEVSFAATLSSKILLNKIETTINKNLKIHKIQYHSALLLNFMAMRILIPEKNNFVSIHVHSELTDIVVVKNGLSANLSSFPIGISTILRKLTTDLKETAESTESMLSLYEGGKLDSLQEIKFKELLDPLLKNWYLEYIKSVDHEDDGVFIPRTAYLSTHSNLGIFKKVINENNELAKVIDFEINSINPHVIFEKNSEYNQLIGMYALTLRSMI
jgi:hypothetical protein